MIELLDIVGQDVAIARLQREIAGSRMPHAYIFAGPAGVGRRTTAVALTKTLLCREPVRQGNSNRFADLPDDFSLTVPCGQCRDCQMMAAGSHPDFHLIYKELARYHDDPDVRGRVMQEVGIDVIRSFLIAPTTRRAARGRGKVFVVLEAELMSVAAQSALLKTLEEPPEDVTIILVCVRGEQLLPTTLSRCAMVRFAPLPREFVTGRLIEEGVDDREAEFWSAFTGGSIGRSAELHALGMYAVKCDLVDRLAELGIAGDADLAEHLVETTEKHGAALVAQAKADHGAVMSKLLASRRAASAMLGLISSAFTDALTLSVGADRELVHSDQAAGIKAIAGRFAPGELCEIIEQISGYERLLWRNVNPKIVWDNVVITCASAAALGV